MFASWLTAKTTVSYCKNLSAIAHSSPQNGAIWLWWAVVASSTPIWHVRDKAMGDCPNNSFRCVHFKKKAICRAFRHIVPFFLHKMMYQTLMGSDSFPHP